MGDSKVCEKHCKHKKRRRIAGGVFGFLFLVVLTVFIIWLVLRPTSPRFTLRDAVVLQLNLSASAPPYLLTTVVQPTIATRNPNDRIGVYYDRLHVYAAYRDQQITLAADVPAFYQGHGDVSVWSPVLYGVSVPVPQYLCAALAEDQQAGVVLVHVRVSGKVRWKVGSWTSGRYHLDVSCPAVLAVIGSSAQQQLRFQQISRCSVDV